jgi:bacterioferritin
MKGHVRVIEILNQVLTNELTAINQYFIHAKMCANWGYQRLAKKSHDESIGEMKHADKLIERILFLEGIPNLQRLGKVNVGENVPEQFAVDLRLENEGRDFLVPSIEECRTLGDFGSWELLVDMLKEEEEHIDWLETQIDLVKKLGEVPYLAEQMHS